MKTLLLFGLLFITRISMAQTPARTRFYFFNNSGQRNFEVRTNLNADNPVSVNARNYALLETDADSLSFLSRNGSHPIPFDSGQTYYFVATITYVSGYVVSEVSERIFWLTLHINNAKKPKSYLLSKDGTVQEQ